MKKPDTFASLEGIARFFRASTLEERDILLLFAHNGTGKTRLSMTFKDLGNGGGSRDTLYFNAFTEDLFSWDNDLARGEERVLRLNRESNFFAGLKELEMTTRIRPFLRRYADFDFALDEENGRVSFSRQEKQADGQTRTIDNIKISRGEERLFIWCFFLAIVQLALDGAEAYAWVRYIYVDDPISSLDDNNVIVLACDFAKMIRERGNEALKVIISTHHALFFSVLHNEFRAGREKRTGSYLLSKEREAYTLTYTNDSPFLHHVYLLKEILQAVQSGELYTYHFNMLRTVMEKTAQFHGFKNFSACLSPDAAHGDHIIYTRMLNLLSHGQYSLFEAQRMVPENREHFQNMLDDFLKKYPFTTEILPRDDRQGSP